MGCCLATAAVVLLDDGILPGGILQPVMCWSNIQLSVPKTKHQVCFHLTVIHILPSRVRSEELSSEFNILNPSGFNGGAAYAQTKQVGKAPERLLAIPCLLLSVSDNALIKANRSHSLM